MILEATAEYIPEGDVILATAYVLDATTDVFHPELVKNGTAVIQFLGTNITKVVDFDKRMGNSDGAFKFTFSRPPKTKNIQLFVSVSLVGDLEFSKSVNVTIENPDEIPLAANPQSDLDFRGRLRKEEGL
jgi:hypothetical protein